MPATLVDNLDVSSRRRPEQGAIRFRDRRLSYRELKSAVDGLAGWLQREAGVAPGDRVLLLLQNSPQFVIGFYAALRAGAIVVPANPMLRADELRHLLADSGSRVALCAADLESGLRAGDALLATEERLRRILVVDYDAPALPVAELTEVPLRSGDIAVLAYTSGTTGMPKGCMHSHRTIMHNVRCMAAWHEVTEQSIALAVAPLFHVTGMLHGMHIPIFAGATAVQMLRWDRDVAAALIARERITHFMNVPTMVIDLLAHPDAGRFDLSSLRRIGGGGAPMPQAVAQKLHERFGLTYCEGYGLTETAAPSHANPPQRPKPQCLGIPIPGTEARIVDPETLRALPSGEIGEIIVRGPQVFLGYWRDPEATAAAFVDFDGLPFLRTGDLGRVDEDGYFFLVDRRKRMINASGFKVSPAEVELLLHQHPSVQEACVIGRRDAYRGETVKALVVLRSAGGVTGDELIAWARTRMAAYKVPRLVEFLDALPKSGSGKVMWQALQERENATQPLGLSAS